MAKPKKWWRHTSRFIARYEREKWPTWRMESTASSAGSQSALMNGCARMQKYFGREAKQNDPYDSGVRSTAASSLPAHQLEDVSARSAARRRSTSSTVL